MNWFEILRDIDNAKGKQKLEILKEHKDDEVLQQVLYFAFSPRVVTGISRAKINKGVETYHTFFDNVDERVISLMDYLMENNTGRDEDISTVKSLLEDAHSELEKEFLNSLIIKDMPIGISASTINKVWEELVPVFKLQKGKLWDGSDLENEVAVSLKLDGNSATVFNLEDETYMLSRSGAIMEGFDHVINEYKETMPKGYVYQGELIAKNYDKLEHGPLFQLSNGITNSKKHNEKIILQHVVFDVIKYEDFKKGKSNVKFVDRIDFMKEHINKEYDPYDETFEIIEKVPYYDFTASTYRIIELAKLAIDDGLEGLMLCETESIYKVGPQNWLQKVKEFQTIDLEVIDLKEHVRGNKVGSLIVNYHGSTVNVGGIKDVDRINWWNEPNLIIGKIIEVKFFRKSVDKHGNKSLRFPTLERIRDDKFEESYE